MVPHLLSRYKKKKRKNEGRKKENTSPGELQQGTENGMRKKEKIAKNTKSGSPTQNITNWDENVF